DREVARYAAVTGQVGLPDLDVWRQVGREVAAVLVEQLARNHKVDAATQRRHDRIGYALHAGE
ncbi:MAG: hypothetical protein QOI69_1914, partial [Pseudonocardiales bacterium]|nr:hypothetical protein [Pseudonocardiales bacterium]